MKQVCAITAGFRSDTPFAPSAVSGTVWNDVAGEVFGKRIIAAVLALATAGCSFLDLRPKRNAPEEFRAALELPKSAPGKPQPTRFQPPPAAVADALLPDLGAPAATGKSFGRERRFDISVMGADAREFFMGLVADSAYNVIVHPGLKGTITIDLKNVTLPEVLEAVREVYGYDYKKTEAGYIIYPAEIMSRLFHLDYINFVRNGRSETRVSAGQSSQLQRGGTTVGVSPYGGNGGGVGGYGGQTTGYASVGGGDGEELVDCRNARAGEGQGSNGQVGTGLGRGGVPLMPGSVIATTSTSHFWKELKQALSVIVCAGEGANFVVNQQGGVIVVRAFPKQLREVEQFLDALRQELQRQVVLEAKILEVVLKDGYQAGINWAYLINHGQQAMLTSLGGPASIGQVFTIDFGKATGINMNDFKAYIELLETQGEVHTLSSPRISTLNNQKAVIKVGSDEFFVTDITSTTVTGTGATTVTPSIGLTPFFSGIALDVTPQIDDGGMVTLHVHPSVTEVTDQTKRITLGGQEQDLPLAFSTVRESDSVVQAQNGQIIVIGGLMQNQQNNDRQGVAWFNRIPGLGSLFRRGTGSFQKSELVILLKPTVIQNQADWNRAHKEISDRAKALEGESRRQILP